MLLCFLNWITNNKIYNANDAGDARKLLYSIIYVF